MCFNDHMRRLFGFDEAVIFTGAINSLLQLLVSYITMSAFTVFYIVIMTRIKMFCFFRFPRKCDMYTIHFTDKCVFIYKRMFSYILMVAICFSCALHPNFIGQPFEIVQYIVRCR